MSNSISAPQSGAVEIDTAALATAAQSCITDANDDIEATPLSVPAKPRRTYVDEAANDASETAEADSSNIIPIGVTEECGPTPVSPTLPMAPAPSMPSIVVGEEAVSTEVALPSSPIDPAEHDVPESKTIEPPSVPFTAAAAIPRVNDSSKQVPKLPGMPRSQTAVPVDDPLAEVRARLKKKQSSSALPTANSGSVAAARAAILGTGESKAHTSALPSRAMPKAPVKSVRNLVAMFEQS
ncbi:hypothetical protein H4S07_001133 [Coemansia furcata]|uniref:Uncharacterized protein n=1 Tax=Coemansia furcata TaxID=417177 RepID=A0ACC1LPB9_9FUNG|nr:hypothetical protein H4S07_001133 [Coemansia furcata]